MSTERPVSEGGGPNERILLSRELRVQMADTDAAGLIYFTAPCRWHEGLFTSWLAEIGHPLSRLLADGLGFPMVHAEADYLAMVRLDDVMQMTLKHERHGHRSIDLRTDVTTIRDNAELLVMQVRTRHVFSSLDSGPKLASMPNWLTSAL